MILSSVKIVRLNGAASATNYRFLAMVTGLTPSVGIAGTN
jgi:hypothetical protein